MKKTHGKGSVKHSTKTERVGREASKFVLPKNRPRDENEGVHWATRNFLLKQRRLAVKAKRSQAGSVRVVPSQGA